MGNYNGTATGKTYASNAKGNVGVTLGAVGLGLGLMNANNGCGRNGNNGLLGNLFGGNNDCYVDEKEFAWAQAWNASQAELAKEKSERYTDGIGLELYKEIIAETKAVDDKQSDSIAVINAELVRIREENAVLKADLRCLSVVNDAEHKAIATKAATDVQIESERRACADETIMTYVKGNYIKGTLKLDADTICPEVQLKCPDVQLVELVSQAAAQAVSMAIGGTAARAVAK